MPLIGLLTPVIDSGKSVGIRVVGEQRGCRELKSRCSRSPANPLSLLACGLLTRVVEDDIDPVIVAGGRDVVREDAAGGIGEHAIKAIGDGGK